MCMHLIDISKAEGGDINYKFIVAVMRRNTYYIQHNLNNSNLQGTERTPNAP